MGSISNFTAGRHTSFTVGFDGKTLYAPIGVQNFYNVDVESVVIKCRGDVADMVLKYPERVQFSSTNNVFVYDGVERDQDGAVLIKARKR